MKKFLSLVVAALLSVSAVATSASAVKFTDVDVNNEALTDAVELLTALNVTKGTSDTEFGTAQNVTREQMAAFIYRMMKAGKSVEGGVNTTSFTDLDDPTFYFMVSWANNQGIIKGRSATSFDPKGGITLQDAYTMIIRALGYDDGTLAYPIGYISKAEDLGLDEDLPSTLNYTDTLTRGDVAIILANMFYAETAEVEIKYVSDPYYHEEADEWFEGPSKPVEYHKTVAEAVFEVEKISRRVVATPNYSFGDKVKPDEDVEMITLEKVDADADTVRFPTEIEFSELGLDGSADDYFLNDIVMFVRDIGTQKEPEYEVFGATAAGTKTTVSFDDVEFGTVSGSTLDKYYDADKEYKHINGKITLGDIVTYVAKAPYSYTKDGADVPEFITLTTYDGDMKSEDEEDHIKFNYVIDTAATVNPDALGTLVGFNGVEDEKGNVTYSKNTEAYLAQLYFGGAGEIDVIDCDGDGKPEYLFVKNYVVGTIDDTEEESVQEIDATDIPDTSAEDLLIKTDYSIVEGVEAEDNDIVLAYVNPMANYVKIAEVLTGKEASITTTASKYFAISTGEKIYYKDAQSVVLNGAVNGIWSTEPAGDVFNNEATYYFTSGGKLVLATGLETAIALDTNYVVVLDDAAFKTSAIIDGKIATDYYISIYNDNEIKAVKALSIDKDSKYTGNVDGEDVPENERDTFEETPVTNDCKCEGDVDHGDYCYKAYENKLATGKSTSKGAYYFKLLDTSIYNTVADAAKLTSSATADKENTALEFRATNVNNTTFTQKTGNIYEISALASVNDKIKGVYIQDYTQIIIRSRDEDGEWIVTAYGKDNLPNIKEDTKFQNVTYVLVNNKSTIYENLVVFYGVIDEELKGATGEMAEVRVIKSYSKSSTEDGTLYTYDVFNPLTGKAESGIEGVQTDGTGFTDKGAIVALTTEGYINDEVVAAGNVYEEGAIYNIDGDNDFEDYDGTAGKKLGYVEVEDYDDETKLLMTNATGYGDAFLQITDETVVSFVDKSEETIKVVDADVLASTSKTYRWADDKNNDIRVFVSVEESADYDDDEQVYDVLFAMIVRD